MDNEELDSKAVIALQIMYPCNPLKAEFLRKLETELGFKEVNKKYIAVEEIRGIVARDNRMFEKVQTFRNNLYKARSFGNVNIDYVIRKIDEEFSEYLSHVSEVVKKGEP